MNSESQVKSPGRPRAFDRDAVLEQLLLLFWEVGFDQVSQQQMSAATGLSTSSLYNTFGTKAETFHEVLGRYLERTSMLFEPLEHGTRGREDLLDQLDRFRVQLESPLGRAGCLIVTSMATLDDRDEAFQALAAEHRERLRAAFAAALRRGRALGEPLPDPDTTAPLLVAATLGSLLTARAETVGDEASGQLAALRALVSSWR
jgi:AcrR family transcriptional regulator